MFQLTQRGGSLCRLCLLRTPSSTTTTTTKTFSSLIQKENRILTSFTPLSLSSSLPSSPYSPLSSSLSYSRGLGGSPLSSPLSSSVSSSSSSSLLPPPSSFLPPSSPLPPSSFLPPASPSSSRLFSQSQNKLAKDDEESDGDTLGGGVVPRSVNPIQEIRRLLSLPFKEEVLVFPIFEKPFVPMTTGQHVVPHSPFLEKLLELSSVKRDGRVGMFLVQDPDQNNQDAKITYKNIQKTGVLGGIVNIQPLSDVDATNRKYVLFLAGLRRVKIVGEGSHTGEDGLLSVKIEPINAFPYDKNDIKIRALVDALTNNIHELLRTEMNPLYRNHLESLVKQINPNDPAELADLAAAFSSPGRDELQEVIEELDVQKRLTLAVSLLKKELEVNRFQMQIQKQLEEKMSANHRKFLMTEQLKMLKKELGLEKDDKEALLAKYKERLEALDLPERAEQVANDEMNKLSTLEPSSSEYNVTRTYLDWLTTLPWGVYSEDNLDLAHAKSVLEDEHFGLDDIKDLILEFIAVGHLRGGVRGKIFCFVGPPGVGKTSIGKSIANALGRKFFRFSVGGLSDVAEIKGHRRTYVGAMPGKLVQAIKQVQSSNPVIMIDEIDKMQKGYQGDPASALLEVLDPEQNGSFLDHYLDVPYDFSKILFLCTANVIDTIPKPLQDRMEIVRLSGYVLEEKVQIAKQYLIPQTMEEMGLKKDQVSLHSNAVRQLINRYCRESGVRNLQKHIEKLLRKAAYKIVTDSQENDGKFSKISVMEKNLVDYVGKPVFTSDRFYMKTPVGVTMGLSWTAMGGATLYIEVVVEPGSKGEVMRTTGKMGDVMKESTEIAYTYAKTYLDYLLNTEENVNLRVGGPRKKKMRFPRADKEFFQKNMVHLHVPEGATPKDGPSAGVTMVTSLLSLALNRHVNPDIAMTGELTVSGKVLPIGGVKEKTIAAKRSKVTHVIFPIDNKKDYEELPDNIKEGLTVHYAKYYHDVFDVAFGQKGKKSVKGTVEEAEVEEIVEVEVEE